MIETRDKHLKTLHRLIKKVREEDGEVDKKYLAWRKSPKSRAEKVFGEFNKLNDKLQKNFAKFLFKQKVIEEMALVADNIHDKMQQNLRSIEKLREAPSSSQVDMMLQAEEGKLTALEAFVRKPAEDYLNTYEELQHFAGEVLKFFVCVQVILGRLADERLERRQFAFLGLQHHVHLR